MAVMTVDLKKMQGTVKSGIGKGVNDLNSAVSIISGAKIPKDFPAGAKAKGYNNEIQDVIKTLNSVSNWIDTTVNKFEQTEAKNKALVESLIGSLSTSSNANAPSSGYAARSGQKTGKTTTFGGGLSAFFSNFNSEKTGAKVTRSTHLYDSASSYAASSGSKYGANTKTTTFQSGWKSFTSSLKDGAKELKRVGCDVVNVVAGGVEGVGEFFEGVLKSGVDVLGKASKIITVPRDKVSYLWNKAMGTPEKYKSWTSAVQKSTMSFISVNHVENLYNSFYKTKAGKYLNNNAHSPFKTDGKAINLAKGAGKMAMPFLVEFLTKGAVKASWVAGVSTYGNSLGKFYQEAESKSWKGIEKQYKNGTIDKNTYKKYLEVRKMNDKEWNKITKKYKNGKMSKEEYEQLKNIREMPEDWRNNNTEAKGTLYGVMNGLWEYFNYEAADKAGSFFGLTETQTALLDSGINSLDTPFKALTDTICSGKNYKQAFEEQGGWKQMGVDAILGLGMYGGSKLVKKFRKKRSKAEKVKVDETETINAKEIIEKEIKDGEYINLADEGKINKNKVEDTKVKNNEPEKVKVEDTKAKDVDTGDGKVKNNESEKVKAEDTKVKDVDAGDGKVKNNEPEKVKAEDTKVKDVDAADGKVKDNGPEKVKAEDTKVKDVDAGDGKVKNNEPEKVKVEDTNVKDVDAVNSNSGETEKTKLGENNQFVREKNANKKITTNDIENVSQRISNGDYKGAAEYLYNNTNVTWDKTEMKNFQQSMYERIKSSSNKLEDSEKVGYVLQQLTEMRGGYETVAKCGNIKINAIKDINWNNAQVDIQTLVNDLDKLPKELRESISEINITDSINCDDVYWKNCYDNPSHVSAMTGGANGQINVYTVYNYENLTHEAGHCLDSKLNITEGNNGAKWLKAMDEDMKYAKKMGVEKNKIGISDYADSAYNASGTLKEDFAEAIRLYNMDKEAFIYNFPNRYKIIKKYLTNK